ncbi:MAG: hypothetical protein WKF43_12600 [Acidimicrobiales bacterium]
MGDTNNDDDTVVVIPEMRVPADFLNKVATLRQAMAVSGLYDLTADFYQHALPTYRGLEKAIADGVYGGLDATLSDGVYDHFSNATEWGGLYGEVTELASALLDAIGADGGGLVQSRFLSEEEVSERHRRQRQALEELGPMED